MSELMGICEIGERAFGLEGEHWRRGTLLIQVAQRRAE